MILVLRDPGQLESPGGLLDFLGPRVIQPGMTEPLLCDRDSGTLWGIDLGEAYAGKSKLEIKAEKLRVFFLEGASGRDFLSTLDREAREISSERRLLPEPDLLDESFAAKLLTATESPGDDADTFRRAGMLSVRRFAWSVALRKAEILALDLPPDAWPSNRNEFYRFAQEHVVCADKLLNHTDTLGRLLSLAVACGDVAADRLVRKAAEALSKLRPECKSGSLLVNGGDPIEDPIAWSETWERLADYLDRLIHQAVARAWTCLEGGSRPDALGREILDVCERLGERAGEGDDGLRKALENRALCLLRADLARPAVAEFVLPSLSPPRSEPRWFDVPNERTSDTFLREVFGGSDEPPSRFEWVDAFLDVVRAAQADWPELQLADGRPDRTAMFFATRPVRAQVIAQVVPESYARDQPVWALFEPGRELPASWRGMPPSHLWAGLLGALRGIAITKEELFVAAPAPEGPDGPGRSESPPIIELPFQGEAGRPRTHRGPLVALANVRVEDQWWEAAASGKPQLTTKRYLRVARLINDVLRVSPAPDYFVMPELSVPRRWARSLARFLNDGGIGFIAGVEYGHGRKLIDQASPPCDGNRLVANQAIVSVHDTRLGYRAVTELWQTKTTPAPHEGEQLHAVHGRRWNGGLGAKEHPRDRKPVYHHGDLYFGLLVCSELRNVHYRLAFQGNVDLALVVSWNQDLMTFEPLVESAALDVHAYVGLVNNARYGDTRLRVPARLPHERDVCRVRGGLNDYAVVAEIDVHRLRAFHSHDLSWVHEGDLFKPVPEGFKVSPRRWKIPSDSPGG